MNQNDTPREKKRIEELRDKIAISAMTGILASGFADPTRQEHYNNIAEDAYRMADAMLIAKNQTK